MDTGGGLSSQDKYTGVGAVGSEISWMKVYSEKYAKEETAKLELGKGDEDARELESLFILLFWLLLYYL